MRTSAERIDRHSTPEPTSGCLLWTGPVSKGGYGRITIYEGGRKRLALVHRVAWQNARGPIPDGLLVCHKCDVPSCVNAEHLFLGTYLDNAHDRDAKNRTARGAKHFSRTSPDRLARGDRNGSRLHPETRPRGDDHPARLHPDAWRRGESHGRAKLTELQVREIRRQFAEGRRDLAAMAAELGVGVSTLKYIRSGKTWAHLL